MTFNYTQKLLAGTLALVLVAGMTSPAFASLIGDTVHATMAIQGNVFFDESKVVDNTIEFVNPVFSGSESIDVGEKTISLIYSVSVGGNIGFGVPRTYVIDSLDWVDEGGNAIPGEILGVLAVSNPDNISIGSIATTAHSITIVLDQGFDIGGGEPLTKRIDITLDVSHDTQVAGELLPLDSTALFLAGLSSMSVFMIPAIVGLAGAGVYLVKFRANRD